MTTYNDRQQQAIYASTDATVCIIAGAGTGKTETLSQRYITILQDNPDIHPRNIVVLTFTDKAATEMRARMRYAMRNASLPFDTVDMAEAHISTFHAFAARLALRRGIPLNLNQNQPFCDEITYAQLADDCWEQFLSVGWHEALARFQTVIDSYDWNSDPIQRDIHAIIADMQGCGITLSELERTMAGYQHGNEAFYASILLWNFRQRRAALAEAGQLNLDDIINVFPWLVAQHPELLRDVRYVLVDEYQDTSTAQAQLLEHLTPRVNGNFVRRTVAGDPRQAIYVWRQAKVENIARINAESEYAIALSRNFRSRPPILQVANRSLNDYQFGNPPEFPAHEVLVSGRDDHAFDDDCVRIHTYDTYVGEALGICERIIWLHETKNIRFREMAILLRQRTHLSDYIQALEACGIPFDQGKDDPFFRRHEILNAIHVALALYDPYNEQSVTRTLLTALACIDEVSLHHLRAQHPKQTLWDVLQQSASMSAPVQQFVAVVQKAQELQWYHAPSEWLYHIWHMSGFWERQSAYGQRMLNKLLQECDAVQLPSVAALCEFLLHRLRHQAVCLTPELMSNADAVQIMTVHAAKGLEFAAVFVVDAHSFTAKTRNLPSMSSYEGQLVDMQADHQPRKAEILRQQHNELQALWYVALTRAKSWLMISGTAPRRKTSSCFDALCQQIVQHPIPGVFYEPTTITQTSAPRIHPHSVVVNAPTPVLQLHSKPIIRLAPSSVHEVLQCPRRYRFQRRSGMDGMIDPELFATETPAPQAARTFVVSLTASQAMDTYDQEPAPTSASQQYASEDGQQARLIGSLFHLACEQHAHHPRAGAAQLLSEALVLQPTALEPLVRAQLVAMLERYLSSPIGNVAPATTDVEQRLHWSIETPAAIVEMSGIIDRWYGTSIIDYKTDEELAGIDERHGDQLRLYGLAVLQTKHRSEMPTLAVYHARSATIVEIPHDDTALQRTKQRLQTAATIIVNGEYVANPSTHYCRHCPAIRFCPEGQQQRPATTHTDELFDW